jgi:hypothetical protein
MVGPRDRRAGRRRTAAGRRKRPPVRAVYVRVIVVETAILVALWFLGRAFS